MCKILLWFLGVGSLVSGSNCWGQATINEFVVDERTAGSGFVHPSTREFLEIYNAGTSPLDISNWTLKMIQIGTNFGLPAGTSSYAIPGGTSIPANDYFVIGHSGSTNVDFAPTPLFDGDLFPDGNTTAGASSNGNFVFELRNASSALVDAAAVETFRTPERANISAEELPFVGGGIWSQVISANVTTGSPQFNAVSSVARYSDGHTTGVNGQDFGFLPATPGTSNNLPQVSAYVAPNVDSLVTETPLGASYGFYGSFKLPAVADPTVNDGTVNQKAVPAAPVGSKVIMAYDNTGGGNVAASKSLVHSFDLYTYIDTDPYNLIASHTTDSFFAEQTIYGIGTADPFFNSANSSGLLTTTSTSNGSTGVGWFIHKVERDFGTGPQTKTMLQLVDFGDGGDSVAAAGEWKVISQFDLTSENSAWHRIAINYDPATNMVTARYDDKTFQFLYSTLPGDFDGNGKVDMSDYVVWRKTNSGSYSDFRSNFGRTGGGAPLVGTFYAGYRDGLDDSDGTIHYEVSRPATFVQYQPAPGLGSTSVPEPCAVSLALLGILCVSFRRRLR
jgi:hypothetical protein